MNEELSKRAEALRDCAKELEKFDASDIRVFLLGLADELERKGENCIPIKKICPLH